MIDPIVEEVRKAGQAYIDSFNGDLKAVCEDLRRRSEQAGRRVVSRPPRRIEPVAATRQKTGAAAD